MKKNLFIALSLLASSVAMAGTPALDIAPQPAPERSPLTFSITGGIMHTDVDYASYYGEGNSPADTQTVPSVLYGGSIGVGYVFKKTDTFNHEVAVSIGCYTGEQSFVAQQFDTTQYPYTAGYGSGLSTDVTALPIQAAYNLEYAITDGLSVFAGARAGLMIRKTSVTDEFLYKEDARYTYKEDSTEVLPMLGIGVGARAYITENLSFTLSYDLSLTFGDDCDVDEEYYPATNMDCRYYGTISGGFIYAF